MNPAAQLSSPDGHGGRWFPAGIPIRRGRPGGRRRIEELFIRLQGHAPDVFDDGDVSLHSYRQALGTFTDGRFGGLMTRAVPGRSSQRTPTGHCVHIPRDNVAAVLAEHEEHRSRGQPMPAAERPLRTRSIR